MNFKGEKKMITYEIFLKSSTIKTNDIRLAHEYRDNGYTVIGVVESEEKK
jgi:hypothetical protein